VRDVLLSLARAAAGDPEALDAARDGWPALTPAERAALTGLGRLLAGASPASPHLAVVLDALAAGDLARARQGFPALTAAERPAVAAVGRHLAAPPTAGAAAMPATRPRIRTDRSPEDLLALMGLTGFRPRQRDAVQAALDGRDTLVVMPTGGGKSLCYQLPALAGDGLTVVVSPLIALIGDQHRRLVAAGHRSAMVASTRGDDENARALADVRDGRAQIVFCAPERFASTGFRAALAAREVVLFVVDEAHCVSEWGHDFRPDYLRLAPVIAELGRPAVMAATATATPRVADEIVARLGLRDPLVIRRGFDRPNITFDVVALGGDGAVARKRALLRAGLAAPEGRPAIVYCGTRRDAEQVGEMLAEDGLRAGTYHAGMDQGAREEAQRAFMAGDLEVMVATNAFGQGIDKADIRAVWHWALPTSVEAYYQEAGRAGRDGAPARAVLLAMRADLGRLVRFIRESEVTVDRVETVVGGLRRAAGDDGVALVDTRGQDDRQRIALAVAERAGAVALSPAPGGRLAARLTGALDRGAVRAACRAALDRRWTAYAALKDFVERDDVCRRRRLLDHFGSEETPAPVVRCCDVCAPPELPEAPAPRARRRGTSSPPAAEGPPVDAGQMEALRRWRTAAADGKPAYTVATNATLEEILRRRPASADELLAIRGIGPAFVERHADDLLALLPTLS